MSANQQLLTVKEGDADDEMKLRRTVQEKLGIAKVSLDPTPLRQNPQWPWIKLESNVCAILINLGSRRGKLSVTDEAYRNVLELETNENKRGYVIYFRRPGQLEVIAGGAEVRCFRR